MKRILAAALSLALLGSLAACGGKDRFDTGKVEEGVCYQLTSIAPDAVAMRVDGIDVPMDMYFYNLCYAASYMESYMNMYGMDLDWSMELQEGETVLDVTKDSILENTKSFAVIEHRRTTSSLTKLRSASWRPNARRPSRASAARRATAPSSPSWV